MSTTRVLIVYGSTYGQTEKIARRIAETLEQEGIGVTLQKGDQITRSISPQTYDGILVAASVIGGKYQKYIKSFVLRHRGALQGVPSAFLAVSGSAGGTEAEKKAAQEIIAAFLQRTGWTPRRTASIAGAIQYTKYNPLLRWIMKRMMAKAGRPSDPRQNYEFTNWDEVDAFARDFRDLVYRPVVLAGGDARASDGHSEIATSQ